MNALKVNGDRWFTGLGPGGGSHRHGGRQAPFQ